MTDRQAKQTSLCFDAMRIERLIRTNTGRGYEILTTKRESKRRVRVVLVDRNGDRYVALLRLCQLPGHTTYWYLTEYDRPPSQTGFVGFGANVP